MRAAAIALVAFFGLAVIPSASQAAPAVPPGSVVAAPELMLVRDGCGRGYHLRRWRDRYGRWHRSCVPNRRYYGPRRRY